MKADTALMYKYLKIVHYSTEEYCKCTLLLTTFAAHAIISNADTVY